MLTHTIFLDFDGATAAEMQAVKTSVNSIWDPNDPTSLPDGSSFVGEIAKLQTQFGGYECFSFLDFNNDGVLNQADGDLAANAIMDESRERFLGYDIQVQRVDNTAVALTKMNNGVEDTLVFLWGWNGPATDVGVGLGGGQMPGGLNEQIDDAGEVGGSVTAARALFLGNFRGQEARKAFVGLFANFIAHEAGHAYGLDHVALKYHPAEGGINLMTPDGGGVGEARFRDATLTAEYKDQDEKVVYYQQNAVQQLFDRLGARSPVDYDPHTGALRVIGDTNRASRNDVFAVDTANGWTRVRINSVLYQFSFVTTVTLDAGDGDDSMRINSKTGIPFRVLGGTGSDILTVGAAVNGLSGVSGQISFSGGGQSGDTLSIDDRAFLAAETYTVTDHNVTSSRIPGLAISYDAGVREVKLSGANLGSTARVESTAEASFYSVSATNVQIGRNGSVQEIRGEVDIDRLQNLATVVIDDSQSPLHRNIVHESVANGWGRIRGLAPAPIFYRYSRTRGVTLHMGACGAALSLEGAGNILAPITIGGAPNSTVLTVSDAANLSPHGDVRIDRDSIVGLAPASIAFDPAALISLKVIGGKGNDRFAVLANTAKTIIDASDGIDTVNVGGDARRLNGIGQLEVTGSTNTTLNLNDQENKDEDRIDNFGNPYAVETRPSYTVTNNKIVRLDQLTSRWEGLPPSIQTRTGTVEYNGVGRLFLNGGMTSDVFYVQSVAGATPVSIEVGGGIDAVYVGSSDKRLKFVKTLAVQGNGFTKLSLNDANNTDETILDVNGDPKFVESRPIYTINGAQVLRTDAKQQGTATVAYNGLASLALIGGKTADVFNVQGGATPVSIDVGGGVDTVNVGDAAKRLVGLRTLSVKGNDNTTLNLNDQGNADGQRQDGFGNSYAYQTRPTYTLAPTKIARSDLVTTQWPGSPASVQTLSSTITVSRIASLRLNGGQTGDIVRMNNASADTRVAVDGGAGLDTVDYTDFTGAVTVNLTAGMATGIKNGLSNIENVTGSTFDDLLVGNALVNVFHGGRGSDVVIGLGRRDQLFGDAGRDLLIGGRDGDTLDGGSDDDILIGGLTAYDTQSTSSGEQNSINVAALNAIMAEWRSTRSYAERVANVRSGGTTGGSRFDSTTVSDDAATDSLSGRGAPDWFWGGASEVEDRALAPTLEQMN